MVNEFLKRLFRINRKIVQKPAKESYDIWADSYDAQPENLMLMLDEEIFTALLQHVDLKDKQVADIGCGTGRHWEKMLAGLPAHIKGFDISPGMLQKLRKKFPGAECDQISDNRFEGVQDNRFDIIISTLTIAHIENIEEALKAWCRILKKGGEIIITDFHPAALAKGGKRTFRQQNQTISITNFAHQVEKIKLIAENLSLQVMKEEVRTVNEKVKKYYAQKNALAVYHQFMGMPMIYGLFLKQTDGLS